MTFVYTFVLEAPVDFGLKKKIAIIQLFYGVPSIIFMLFSLVFLGVSKKYENSFYRLVQMDLLTNIICWLNTWICLRSLNLQIGNRYIKFLERFFPGIWNVSTFFANFFFHVQFCSTASMSVHRISSILYFNQYNKFWSRYYLLVYLIFIVYGGLTQIGTQPVTISVANDTIIMSNDLERFDVTRKQLVGYSIVYFLLLVALGITVARTAFKALRGTNSDQGISKKLTKIALTYAVVYSGIPIWTLLNSLPIFADFLRNDGFVMLSVVSDMITLSLPYILLIFDTNVKRDLLPRSCLSLTPLVASRSTTGS